MGQRAAFEFLVIGNPAFFFFSYVIRHDAARTPASLLPFFSVLQPKVLFFSVSGAGRSRTPPLQTGLTGSALTGRFFFFFPF